jgi:hypothetical protein
MQGTISMAVSWKDKREMVPTKEFQHPGLSPGTVKVNFIYPLG